LQKHLKADVFALGKPLHPGAMFVGKGQEPNLAYPRVEHLSLG